MRAGEECRGIELNGTALSPPASTQTKASRTPMFRPSSLARRGLAADHSRVQPLNVARSRTEGSSRSDRPLTPEIAYHSMRDRAGTNKGRAVMRVRLTLLIVIVALSSVAAQQGTSSGRI